MNSNNFIKKHLSFLFKAQYVYIFCKRFKGLRCVNKEG